MAPAVIAKILSMQPSFTMSENEIAQYVMHHSDSVVTSTITVIAKNTGTSEASINRFCKKVGFKGFNGFKIALAQENFYHTVKPQISADAGFLASVTQDYQEMLVNTSAMLDEDTLRRAAECLKNSRQIFIFAMSNTACVAHELEFKLALAGIGAKAVVDPVRMRVQAANFQSGDLSVVIAPTLLMRDLYQTVSACKDRGGKVITITSYDSPKLNDLVDYKFITSDKINTHNSISLSNNLTFLFVADVLYSILLDGDKSLRQKKLNSDVALGGYQTMDSHLLEY